jgi:hypothetical protein
MGLQSSPMLLPAPTATAAGGGSQWRTAVAGNGIVCLSFFFLSYSHQKLLQASKNVHLTISLHEDDFS